MTDPTFGGWSLTDARDEWVDAPASDSTLQRLLQSASVACEAFAPYAQMLVEYGADYAASRKTAVLMQARNVWNASKVDPSSGGIGDETFIVRPFPLDWMVRQLLRPKKAVPWVG